MEALTPLQYAEQFYNPVVFQTPEKLASAIRSLTTASDADITNAVEEVWAKKTVPVPAQPETRVAPEWEKIPTPDTNGEFSTPLDGALWMASTYGIPQTPLKGKAPFLQNWPAKASVDPTQIRAWAAEYPGCNFGSVAVPGHHFVFEADKPANGGQTVRERFKQQGHDFTAKLIIESSPGKGHRYYLFAPGVENIGQNAVKHGDFSVRVDGEQCVSPGSVHPTTGRQYRVVMNDGPLTPPTTDEILFWRSERVEKKAATAIATTGEPIPEGERDSTLTRILGKARQDVGADYETLLTLARQHNQRCSPPLSDEQLQKIARSIASYAVKESGGIVFPESQPQRASAEPELPKLNKAPYPVFPDWVMHGTSLYEGFVKPVCAVNSRIPYFMFLPAAALMLNYLALKVRIENKQIIPSFFMVLIGEKGRAIKSTSVEDAIEYLAVAGFMEHAGSTTRSAGGKSLVWTAGSTEGLGLEMTRTNCKNAVLFYDELSTLSNKTEIDSSSLKSHLLSLYESGKFSNTIKSRKESFSLDPRTYCASLIACTTDEVFEDKWSGLTGKSTGLDDRFMFLLQPKALNELTPHIIVNTVAAAMETKKRIEKAVLQQVYRIDDSTPLEAKIGVLGNRTEIRAEKWALYFAVDLGKDSIDEDCIERGLAIAEYEKAVKKYLGSPEAETRIAAAQIKYRRLLERKFDGRATLREMERAMNYSRYGTEGWWRIFEGLKKAGIIAEAMSDGKPSAVVRVPLDN